jgi:hypothetical protein
VGHFFLQDTKNVWKSIPRGYREGNWFDYLFSSARLDIFECPERGNGHLFVRMRTGLLSAFITNGVWIFLRERTWF